MTDKNEIEESEEIEKDQHKNEKEVGIEIEHEHKPTINKIKEYLEKRGCLPPDDFIYNWITEDHMNEFKKYYDNNVGLPEMERRLSVDKENKVYDKIEESLKSFYIDKQYEITQLKNLEMKDKINSRIKFNTYKELINGHLIKKLNPSTSKQEWCLVSKKDNSKILKWFGSSKPSNEEVSKEEKRINYFKNVASINSSKTEEIDEDINNELDKWQNEELIKRKQTRDSKNTKKFFYEVLNEEKYKLVVEKFIKQLSIKYNIGKYGLGYDIYYDNRNGFHSDNIYYVKSSIVAFDVKSFEEIKDQDGKKYIVLEVKDDVVRLWNSNHQFENSIKKVPRTDFDFLYTKASLFASFGIMKELENLDKNIYNEIGDFEWHLEGNEEYISLMTPNDPDVGMFPVIIKDFKSLEEFISWWRNNYDEISKLADIAEKDDDWEKFDKEVGKLQAALSEEDFQSRFNNLLNLVSESKTPIRIKDSNNTIYEVLSTVNTERNKYIKAKNIETNEEKSIGSNELKKGFIILTPEFEVASIEAKFVKTNDGWIGRVVNEDDKDYKIKFVDGPKQGKEETIDKDGIEIIKSSIQDVEAFDRVKDNEGKEYFMLKKDDNEVKLWSIEMERVMDLPISEFNEKYIKAGFFTRKDLEESAKNIKQPLLDPASPYTQGNLEELGYTVTNSNDGIVIAKGPELTFELYEVDMGVMKTLGMYSTIKADFNKKKEYLERSLIKKYKLEQMQDILNQIKNADPSGDKADYSMWICNMIMKDIIKFPEDIDKVKEKLTLFDKVKKRVDIQKDINQYKSFGELAEVLEPYKEEEKIPESKGEEERRKIEEGQKIIFDDGKYKIIQVKNPEACAVLFRGTDWCVKDPKWSTEYLKQADLFYFMKNNKPYALFHKPSAQFFNVHDNPLPAKVVKELYPLVKQYLNCIMLEFENDDIEIV